MNRLGFVPTSAAQAVRQQHLPAGGEDARTNVHPAGEKGVYGHRHPSGTQGPRLFQVQLPPAMAVAVAAHNIMAQIIWGRKKQKRPKTQVEASLL